MPMLLRHAKAVLASVPVGGGQSRGGCLARVVPVVVVVAPFQ
jgi:hypothetical protein